MKNNIHPRNQHSLPCQLLHIHNVLPSTTKRNLHLATLKKIKEKHSHYISYMYTTINLVNMKKIWNKVDCQHSEKRSKTHKRLKECFLIGRNRTKHANFWGSPLFQATYNMKTEKQTINSTYLVSVGCRRLVEGKEHKTSSSLPSTSLPHPTDTR